MEDIISQGGDRPPGGSSRKRLIVGLILTAVAVLVVVEHLPQGHHPAAAHQENNRSGRSVSVRVQKTGPVTGAADPAPSGIGGTTRWAKTARVPRAGARPDWFWPATGRTEPILGLPDDQSGYKFIRVGTGWAITPAGQAACDSCAGPPRPVYYLAGRARRAALIGTASQVAPAAAGDRLWLVSYPARVARELTTSGAAAGRAITLPAGTSLIRGTTRGLLLTTGLLGENAARAVLWDQAARRVTASFDGIVAASATSVAYAPRCVVVCPVYVRDLGTGRDRLIDLASGNAVTNAEFSPDGRYLALQVSYGDGSGGGALAVRLEVAEMATGFLTDVPPTGLSSVALAGFGWPGKGDDLVAELNFRPRVQLASWTPGSPRLAIAGVRPGQEPAALVVSSSSVSG